MTEYAVLVFLPVRCRGQCRCTRSTFGRQCDLAGAIVWTPTLCAVRDCKEYLSTYITLKRQITCATKDGDGVSVGSNIKVTLSTAEGSTELRGKSRLLPEFSMTTPESAKVVPPAQKMMSGNPYSRTFRIQFFDFAVHSFFHVSNPAPASATLLHLLRQVLVGSHRGGLVALLPFLVRGFGLRSTRYGFQQHPQGRVRHLEEVGN